MDRRLVWLAVVVVTIASLFLVAADGRAATLSWDANGGAAPADGSGTWSTTDATWYNGAAVAWTNNTADVALFGAASGTTSYTVTLGSNVIANGINFAKQTYTVAPDVGNLYGVSLGAGGITASASAVITAPLTLTASQAWSVASTSTLTVSGNISGTGGLAFTNSGTVTLCGSNSYSGVTTNDCATLNLNATNAIPSGGTLVVGGTNTARHYVNVNNSASFTATGSLNNTNCRLDFNLGSGTWNGNIWAGGSSTQAIGITVGAAGSGTVITGTLTCANSYTWIQGAGTISIGSINAGANNLNTRDNNTLILTSSGSTWGILQFGNVSYPCVATLKGGTANAFASTGIVDLDMGYTGGTAIIDLGGFDQSLGGLKNTQTTGTGTFTVLNSGLGTTATLTIGNGNISTTYPSGTYPATIKDNNGSGGVLALNKTGTGTLYLNGTANNTYSGGTTVGAGILKINADSALGATTASLTFTGNSTLQAGGSVTFSSSRPITMASGVTATFDTNGYAISVPGGIGGSGNLTKAGNGTLFLTSTNNTYTGSTSVTAGVLQISTTANLPSSTNLNLTGGILQINGGMTYQPTLGTGAGQLQLGNNGGFAAIGGTLVLQLNGGTNTIAWGATGFTPAGSQLAFGSASANSMVDLQNGIDLGGGATRSITVTAGVGGDGAKLSGVLSFSSGTAALQKQGTGLLMLSGSASNTYNGLTSTTGGTLALDKSGAAQAIANGGLTIGTGSLVKYTGASSDMMGTGPVTINGSGQLDVNGATDTIGSVTIVATGATALNTPLKNTAGGGNLTIGALGITPVAGYVTQINTNGGTLTLGGDVTFTAATTGQAQISGKLDLGGATRVFNVNSGGTGAGYDMLIDAGIANGGVTVMKGGRIVLSGANAYTGDTYLANSGGNMTVLRADDGVGLPTNSVLHITVGVLETSKDLVRTLATTGSGAMYMDTTAANNFSSGFSANGGPVRVCFGTLASPTPLTWGSANFSPGNGTGYGLVLNYSTANNTLDFKNSVDLGGAARVVEVDAAGAYPATMSGTLSGTGASGLTKTGSGTLVLASANTYSGTTTVSGGTLVLSGPATLGDGSSTNGLTVGGGVLDMGGSAQTVGAVSITAAAANGDTVKNGALIATSYAVSNTTGTAIVSGNLLGTGATLAKSGAGALLLSGANAFSGTTTLTGGTLQATSPAALAATGSIAVSNAGTTLTVNYGGPADYTQAQVATLLAKTTFAAATNVFGFDTSNAMSGATYGNALAIGAGVTKLGPNMLTLSGSNTYNGATTVAAGTLVLSGDNSGAAGATTVNNLAILRVGAANNFPAGTLTLAGGGLDLRADAGTTFGKDFTVNASSIVNVDKAVGGSGTGGTHAMGNLSIGAQTLTVTGGPGYGLSVGTATLSGAATLNPMSVNLSVAAATASNQNLVLSGQQSSNTIGAITIGSGTVTKQQDSTWTVTGSSTYTGTTTVNGGKLIINGTTSASSAVTVNATGFLAGAGTVGGAVTLGDGLSNNSANVPGGVINLVGGGVGSLTLANNLTFNASATTKVNQLFFDLGNGAGGTDKVVVNGTFNTGATANTVLVFLNQLSGGAVNSGTYTLIQGGTAGANKNYALGTARAGGNLYSSLSVVSNSLQVTVAAGTAGDVVNYLYWKGIGSSIWNTAQWYSDSAGTTAATGPGYQSNVRFAATGAANLTHTFGQDYEINSFTVDAGIAATNIGNGDTKMLTIDATSANSNTAGRGITVSNTAGTTISTTRVGLGSSQTWYVGAGATLTALAEINDFGNGYTLTKDGPGTLLINRICTYTGGTVVNGGILQLSGQYQDYGNIRGAVTINSGGMVQLTQASANGDSFGYNNPALQVSTININAGGTLDSNSSHNHTFTGITVNMSGGTWSQSAGTGYFDLFQIGTFPNGTINVLPSSVTSVISAPLGFRSYNAVFNVASGSTPSGVDLLVSGHLEANGASYGLIKQGSGLMALTFNNSSSVTYYDSAKSGYTGTTLISSGTLQLGNNTTTGNLNPASPIIDNATLAFKRTNTLTQGTDFNSVISGMGGIVQAGSGTTVLNGTNTYTGPTAVNAGALLVNAPGSLTGLSAVTVSGGTLGGTGIIYGSVTVQSAAHLMPGSGGVGSLTVGALTLGSGSVLDYDVASAASYDQTLVTGGGLTINGGGFNLSNGTLQSTFDLIRYSGAIGGAGVSSLSVLNGDPNLSYTFTATGTSVRLTIAPGMGTWTGANSTVWTNTGNWSGIVPDGIGKGASFGGSGTITATADLSGADRTLGKIVFSNNFSTTITGSNTLYLQNTGTPDATIAVTGTHAINANVGLQSAADFTVTGTASLLTMGGNIADGTNGSKGLILTSSNLGSVVLAGNNTFTGDTAINGGTLVIGSSGALLNSTLLEASAGGVSFANGVTAATFGGLKGTDLTLTNAGGGAVRLAVGNNNASTAYTGGMSGSGGLTKVGSGSLSLKYAQGYSGDTVVAAGTLTFGGSNTLPHGTGYGNVVLDGGTVAGTLDLGGYNQQINGLWGAAGAVLGQVVNSGATKTLTVGDGNATSSFAGQIQNAIALVKTGTGTQTLSGSNGYTGGTTVNNGTLNIASADALPTGKSLTISSGGHVVLASGLSHAISLGGLTITSGAGGGVGQASSLVQNPGQAGSLTYGSPAAAPTPEPGTFALLAAGAVAALAVWRRKRFVI